MTIYGMTKKRVSPQINAISALLFGTVLLLLVIINVRESRQERKAMQQTVSRRSDYFITFYFRRIKH